MANVVGGNFGDPVRSYPAGSVIADASVVAEGRVDMVCSECLPYIVREPFSQCGLNRDSGFCQNHGNIRRI
eukprot:3038057-Amphidinium_carterae.1